MATTITINGSDYSLPAQGGSPPWGSDLSDIIVALAAVAASSQGTGDILLSSFNLLNNQATTNITGLSFNTSVVRSAIISYSIYRSTNSGEESEVGQIFVTYKSTAGTWDISQRFGGSSGVTLSITNAGQLQYSTTNLAGTGYSGKLKFKATAFVQA